MSPKRVLLVEDETNIAFLLRESLADLGADCYVETASCGEEALRKIHTGTWDVLITDNRMAQVTGLQLIEALRERSATTSTILVTGYGSEEVRKSAQRLQVFRYLTKPFSLADFKRTVRDALALPSAQEDSPKPPQALTLPMKVTLAGEGNVGKTALIRRLHTGKFEPTRVMSLGVDVHLCDLGHPPFVKRLLVWDVSGQEQCTFTHRAFFRGSKAVGLVYAADDRVSFERTPAWYDEIRQILPHVPIVLAANKSDQERRVSTADAQQLASKWGVPFFETSCLTGQGVPEFFETLADQAAQSLAQQIPSQEKFDAGLSI